MTDHDLKYWLALKWAEGVGNVGFAALVDAFGSPEGVFNASLRDLRETTGIGQKTAGAIKSFSQWEQVEKELESARKHQVSIITYHDPLYPKYLLNIYDFPTLLYVKGTLREEDVVVAVVGSRAASAYGRFSTERLCRELAAKGIVVASGLARGIDTAAHRGSLTGRGRTIAVLGCGIDIIYPTENKELFEKIPAQGAIITEYPFGTPPNGPNFPARNRIISGISLGVVVVEANDKSGSLITARMALEQGREVFAVPGSIDAAGSKGTNKLIKQGAKLIENADDILEEILPQAGINVEGLSRKEGKTAGRNNETPLMNDQIAKGRAPAQELTDGERKLLEHVTSDPINIDTLIAITGEKAGAILNTLLLLELKGRISQLPGKTFIRKEQ
ncbi:MAG: DNA-processing protein DprA [Syntrophales bacterium]|nr:DNA-processing protein DprA [Syntrophales bacterium]